ncbi:Phenylacetyl-CoA acceptor oxidoreductase [Burkholderiales bacterium]|nr:Phenylacetyl-CoA acceptor oxidoreductase [Burkholderiales bacterium]
MSTPTRSPEQIADRISPRQQVNWDWRAAGNFIAGGSGGGLLLWVSIVGLRGGDVRFVLGAGMALIALGLTCVWFEIGRPWRALNTFRHGTSSWMTREAIVALLLFACGLLALWSGQSLLTGATGVLGLAFLYAQARILTANKGIAAWRHPRSLPLVVATGLTEGAGLLVCASWGSAQLAAASSLLAVLAALRLLAWRRYLTALEKDAAPAGAIKALRRIDANFRWVGNVVPALLALLAGWTGLPAVALVAAVLAVLAGWRCKYALICEAAFTQGFALPKLPVRGRR